jgi:hypothetical protein
MLVLLLVLQRFGSRQWGNISELTTENHSVSLHSINADGTLGKDEVGVDFHPEEKVHSSWLLLGRAMAVVGAKMGKDNCGNAEGECAEAQSEVKVGVVGGSSGKALEGIQQTQGEADKDIDSVKGGNSASDPGDAANNPALAEA